MDELRYCVRCQIRYRYEEMKWMPMYEDDLGVVDCIFCVECLDLAREEGGMSVADALIMMFGIGEARDNA